MKDFHAGLGLKRTLDKLDVKQTELANELNLDKQGIWQYTQRESLSTKTIVKCAKILGVTPSEIVKAGEC